MTVFGSDGRVRTEDFHQGDAGYVPRGYGHYIENVGDEPLRVLVGFNSGDYQEISLSTWLAANPDAVWRTTSRLTTRSSPGFPRNVFSSRQKMAPACEGWMRSCQTRTTDGAGPP